MPACARRNEQTPTPSPSQERVHRLLQLRRQLDEGEAVSLDELSAGMEHCCRAALQTHQNLRRQLGCPTLTLPAALS